MNPLADLEFFPQKTGQTLVGTSEKCAEKWWYGSVNDKYVYLD